MLPWASFFAPWALMAVDVHLSSWHPAQTGVLGASCGGTVVCAAAESDQRHAIPASKRATFRYRIGPSPERPLPSITLHALHLNFGVQRATAATSL